MSTASNERQRRLFAETLIVGELGGETRERMFDLYAAHYEASSAALFLEDLADKDWVVMIRDEDRAIRGFSTLKVGVFDDSESHRRIRVLFSGDTVIDRARWGTQALAFEWLRFAGQLKAEAPETPLYWLLISKGHRTYRYLPAFSVEYWPRFDAPTPASIQRLKDSLAVEHFGHYYSRESGIVSFEQSRGHLAPDLAEIPRDESLRPEVAFFLRANPGYRRGDELVCLTELTPPNLKPLARRVFLRGMAGDGAGGAAHGQGDLGRAA